ncbi:MAG: gamma-glutamyl-phosphate reductase, partial [Parcubacteria group bacterium]|nr:gamma-glutamyl-phosphate reductase [Parcubacteria group bacterium]
MNKKLLSQVKSAKKASYKLNILDEKEKNKLLRDLISEIDKSKSEIIKANQKDLNSKPKDYPLFDRLTINEETIRGIIDSLKDVIKLK